MMSMLYLDKKIIKSKHWSLCRFTVTSAKTTNDDIIKDWTEIRYVTNELLAELKVKITDRAKVPLKGDILFIFFDNLFNIHVIASHLHTKQPHHTHWSAQIIFYFRVYFSFVTLSAHNNDNN